MNNSNTASAPSFTSSSWARAWEIAAALGHDWSRLFDAAPVSGEVVDMAWDAYVRSDDTDPQWIGRGPDDGVMEGWSERRRFAWTVGKRTAEVRVESPDAVRLRFFADSAGVWTVHVGKCPEDRHYDAAFGLMCSLSRVAVMSWDGSDAEARAGLAAALLRNRAQREKAEKMRAALAAQPLSDVVCEVRS